VLIKKTHRARSETACRGSVADSLAGQATGLDRRTFLRRSGLAGGGLAALSACRSAASASRKPPRPGR